MNSINSIFEEYRQEVLVDQPIEVMDAKSVFFAGAVAALQVIAESPTKSDAEQKLLNEIQAHQIALEAQLNR